MAYLEKLVDAWQKLVQERRQQQAAQAMQEAKAQVKEVHPAVRGIAEANADLAEERSDLTRRIEESTQAIERIDARLTELQEDYDKIQKRVAAAGLTNAIGQLLRKHRTQLPNVTPHERNLRQRKSKIGTVQVRMMELEEQRSALADLNAAVDDILVKLEGGTDEQERASVEGDAREALQSQQEMLGALIDDYDSYFVELVELDGKERSLIAEVDRFAGYVDENVLWIRSTEPPRVADLGKAREALGWLFDTGGWGRMTASLRGTARARPGVSVFLLLLLVALVVVRMRLGTWFRQSEAAAKGPASDSMLHTLKVLAYTLIMSATWPAVLWFAAWLIASPMESSEFPRSIAAGLRYAAVMLLTARLFSNLCRKNGLGERHFRWRIELVQLVRRHLVWLTAIVVPAFFVIETVEWQGSDARKESLGRAAFVIAYLAVAVFTQRLVRPEGGVFHHTLRRHPTGWLSQLRYVWYPLTVSVPLALVAGAILGYYYTVLYLGWRLVETIWIFIGLLLLNALLRRWLLLRMQRRAIREARERAAQREKERQKGEDGTPVVVEEPQVDITDIKEQSLQFVRTVVVVTAVLGVWIIWAEALPALGILGDVGVWDDTVTVSETVERPDGTTSISEYKKEVPITLADVSLAILLVVLTIVAARNIPGMLEITILERLPFAPSGRYAIATLTCYCITVVGTVLAFHAIGIGWAKVQWLVAAMTVGLGFGLQEIFANFVSGLIILFERPIRVGDAVTVGNLSGVVTRIRIRATTITDWDRKELIVPNKRFITTEVLNWTLSDSIIRVVLPVSIAHGSNVSDVRAALIKVASRHPKVLADPPAVVVFQAFGVSSLDFQLRVYIRREDYLSVLDDLNSAMEVALREANIDIAVPRQEMHIRSRGDRETSPAEPFETAVDPM